MVARSSSTRSRIGNPLQSNRPQAYMRKLRATAVLAPPPRLLIRWAPAQSSGMALLDRGRTRMIGTTLPSALFVIVILLAAAVPARAQDFVNQVATSNVE